MAMSRFAKARGFVRRFRTNLEWLEPRTLLTTTLFLDFGAGIGVGNDLTDTVQGFRDIFGANTGTDLGVDGMGNPNPYNDADPLDFTPLNYDFDLNGLVNNADLTALAAAVVPLVQRALEPFDIDIAIAAASSLADAVTSVGTNNGDGDGEFDAYVFIAAVDSNGVGISSGLFGQAAVTDLGAQTGNNTNEASITFADNVFGSTPGTQGTAAFNQNLAQRIAYTATHEAFHTFSYVHTPDESNSMPASSANQTLLASGDVIRRGSNTRDNPFIVTRFDLEHRGAAVPEPNNYLLAAGDGDIGLRDSDGDGTPDLAYATGTGAHDEVILDDVGGGVIDVDVNAYSDQARTSLIANESYNIDVAADSEGTVLVDASINNDEVRVEATIGAALRLRGGQGIDGIATENDLLTLQSGGLAGVYTSGAPGAGTVVYAGGASVDFSEFENIEADNIPIEIEPLTLSSASIDENDALTLTVDFVNIDTLDTHDVVIDWGDSSPDTVFTLAAGQRSFSRNHTYLDDNPTITPSDNYTITVTITDEDSDTGSQQAIVTVNNVAPTLSLLSATTIDEDGTTTLTGRINDPGTLDTFTLQVNWGDPLSPDNAEMYVFPAGTTDFELTHQYLDDNPSGTISDNYTINLTVSDDDSGSNPGSTSVTVNNVAPVITSTDNSASSEEKAEEGEPVIISGAFTDVGTLDTHEVTFDWGDGTIEPATLNQGSGSGTFSGDHAYAAGGIFTVTITVTDDDTQFDTAVETVFITGAGVQTIDGKQVLFIVGTNEADRVHVVQQGNGNVVVQANFLPGGRRTFSEPIDEIRMYLCAGDDRGTVAASVAIPALLDGGLGNDELNAAGAPAVILGGAGIDSLVGSGANDLLIGGTGQDRLVGNGHEDILIGGDTSYDFTEDDDVLAQQAALLSILAEWNSDRSLDARQANINGTGIGPRLNGDNFLTHLVTVFDDGEIDKLTGSGGTDWFFVFAGDEATDFHAASELLN
jgi:hypothetical protein